jgi:hypothetical protein
MNSPVHAEDCAYTCQACRIRAQQGSYVNLPINDVSRRRKMPRSHAPCGVFGIMFDLEFVAFCLNPVPDSVKTRRPGKEQNRVRRVWVGPLSDDPYLAPVASETSKSRKERGAALQSEHKAQRHILWADFGRGRHLSQQRVPTVAQEVCAVM